MGPVETIETRRFLSSIGPEAIGPVAMGPVDMGPVDMGPVAGAPPPPSVPLPFVIARSCTLFMFSCKGQCFGNSQQFQRCTHYHRQ